MHKKMRLHLHRHFFFAEMTEGGHPNVIKIGRKYIDNY